MIARIRLVLTICAFLTLLMFGIDFVFDAAFSSVQSLLGFDWPGLRTLSPETRYLMGAAGVLLPLMVLSLTAVEVALGTPIISRTKTGGTIRLTPRAVERTVCREVKANVADVIKVGATACQGKGAPRIEVRVAVSDRVDVPTLENQIREETRNTLDRILGVEDTNQIHVTVYEIAGVGGVPGKARVRKSNRARQPEAIS